jgi:protein-disulfide isomerase
MRAIAALLICLGLGLAACKPAGGAGGAGQDDMSLGNPAAKVTVMEFASLGCPICAKWNSDIFQSFKAKYVDTGKVHYVLKEFSTGDAPVAAAGFLLARCAGKDKYFQVVDAVFRQEAELLETDRNAEKRDRLVKVAQSAGIPETQFDACTSNDDSLKAFNDRVEAAAKQYNIDSTPTFIINGKSFAGYQDMAALDKAIADAQAAAK